MSRSAAVVIGRNEGARLVACLASLGDGFDRVVYVDSGSTDGSVAAAEAAGAEVVELDMSRPFTAARARNAGIAALGAGEAPKLVQFIDGDCTLDPGWLETAEAELATMSDVGLVTGWRYELFPDASVYNALCDMEWHQPAGEITACGGDMMVRWTVLENTGGFNPTVIAAEDDEFCLRVADHDWKLKRLPVRMTGHDADMHSFGQWWQRAVRAGHGFAQVGHLHPGYFERSRLRAWVFGTLLPGLALMGLLVWPPLVVLVLFAYGLSYAKTAHGLFSRDIDLRRSLHHAAFLSLSKFPNLQGMLTYYLRRLHQRDMTLIEYK